MIRMNDRWLWASVGAHVAVTAPFVLVAFVFPAIHLPTPLQVPVKIVEAPTPIEQTQPQSIRLSKPAPAPEPPKAEPPPKAVFGLSRDTLRDESGLSNVEIKRGNTIAKEIDQIQTDDDRALPVPTDEYLVTSMPKIRREVRAEYPPEARKARIEGPVIMDVLIDSSGKVVQVDVISGLGYGLDEAAVTAMRGFEFEPAKIQNQAVAVRIRYTYRFELKG